MPDLKPYEVVCPHCGGINSFSDDNWHDELLDDSQDHDIDCTSCKKVMVVTVDLHPSYTAYLPEEDEDADE